MLSDTPRNFDWKSQGSQLNGKRAIEARKDVATDLQVKDMKKTKGRAVRRRLPSASEKDAPRTQGTYSLMLWVPTHQEWTATVLQCGKNLRRLRLWDQLNQDA